jgi:hypothetical protein
MSLSLRQRYLIIGTTTAPIIPKKRAISFNISDKAKLKNAYHAKEAVFELTNL